MFYGIGPCAAAWRDALRPLFPSAAYYLLDEYANSFALPEPEVVRIEAEGSGLAIAEEKAIRSAQLLIVNARIDDCRGPKTPLLDDLVETLRGSGFSLVELGQHGYDPQSRLISTDAFFLRDAMLPMLVRQPPISALARRIETLTGRKADSARTLRDADAVIAHIEVNRKHGVGVLLDRWFGAAKNVLSIRSADQFGGRQDFGAAAVKISHPGREPDAVYARVLDALGSHTVARILCVPYYPDDARTAIAIKEIFGVPMCTFLMDDSEMPEDLMRALLEKSALRLAISKPLRDSFQQKYRFPIGYMPPLAPAGLIPSALQIPDTAIGDPRGALLGNVWGAHWLKLLQQTVKDSGTALDWYSNADFPLSREALIASGIHPQAPHDDEALVKALRATWFAVLPSGTLDARDDRHFVARRSLPSRLIFLMATSQIPVIVLGNRETAAARFVEENGIGLVADYDRGLFQAAVQRILNREENGAMRRRALQISPRYADAGAAEWIWQSLARGEPLDGRFEDL